MKNARILLVSPIATHPQDQGNSARIYSMGRLLQAAGLTVHFLYYQMEGLAEQQRLLMSDCWDYFHPLPTVPTDMQPSEPGYYGLDDWSPAVVGETALRLHKRWHFQAVITNYVWFSTVLEVFGSDVLKILDTHDMFGGRAELFRQAGLAPEWYHTTAAEEFRGFHRADIVLAIQDGEADFFRLSRHKDVRVLGHISCLRARRLRSLDVGDIVAGYLASGNPINVDSFEQMRAPLLGRPLEHVHCIVAGSVCKRLPPDPVPFKSVGYIDHLDDFYDVVDVVLNPMTFGTGLKIKSVEALFEGLPLIATKSAMTGIPPKHSLHSLSGPADLAEVLRGLNPALLSELAIASHESALEYAADVRAAGRDLVQSVLGRG